MGKIKYRYVPCPPEFSAMGNKDGRVLLHRLAAARLLGRSIEKNELVTFKDGDSTNLSPENLLVYPDTWRSRDAKKGYKPERRRRAGTGFYVACPSEYESMANKEGLVFEHRLAAARFLGRPLRKEEIVKLNDGDKRNLSPENLLITTLSKEREKKRIKTTKRRIIGQYYFVECPLEYAVMANQKGMVAEHRLLFAQSIGRPLASDEMIRFKDKNTKNTSLDNLYLVKKQKKKKKFLKSCPYVQCPEEFSSMTNNRGLILQHRLIAAQKIGRPLHRNEFVGFADGDSSNLDPNNLVIRLGGRAFADEVSCGRFRDFSYKLDEETGVKKLGSGWSLNRLLRKTSYEEFAKMLENVPEPWKSALEAEHESPELPLDVFIDADHASQIICSVLQKHGMIPDESEQNVDPEEFVGLFKEWLVISKKLPGVIFDLQNAFFDSMGSEIYDAKTSAFTKILESEPRLLETALEIFKELSPGKTMDR